MASRKQLFHPNEVKQKIQTSQLINRLTDHALSDVPTMDASQVQAARVLLNKVLPDVKAVEIGGNLELRMTSKEQRDASVAAASRADA